MKHFLFNIGILTVLSQVHGDCVQEVLQAKPHDVHDICTSRPNWSIIPHPHDCHKFFVCANHVPEEMECIKNYFFDPILNRCTFGSCSSVEDCVNGWVRRSQDNCHSFEICANGNYFHQNCQDGTYFNEDVKMCLPIEDTPQHKCNCILPPNSIFKDADDCKSYYICVDGKASLRQCRRGYYFNSYLNACVVDLHGICEPAPTMSSEESVVVEVCERLHLSDYDNDETAGRLIFQPDTENCKKFYLCLNGRAFTKYCPEGFYYNRELRICEQDFDGNACEAIRHQNQKKKEEEEKETKLHTNEVIHQEIDANHAHEVDTKPPVKLSLSMTHVKVNVEKDGSDFHTEGSAPVESIMPLQQSESAEVPVHVKVDIERDGSKTDQHTGELAVPPIRPVQQSEPEEILSQPSVAPIRFHNKQIDKGVADEEEMINSSAEVEEPSHIKMKLPLSELKLPTNSHYDKLASKFMPF